MRLAFASLLLVLSCGAAVYLALVVGSAQRADDLADDKASPAESVWPFLRGRRPRFTPAPVPHQPEDEDAPEVQVVRRTSMAEREAERRRWIEEEYLENRLRSRMFRDPFRAATMSMTGQLPTSAPFEADLRRFAAQSKDPKRALTIAALKGLLSLVPMNTAMTPVQREVAAKRAREAAGPDFPIDVFVAGLENENAWIRTRTVWLLPYLIEQADPALDTIERMLRTERADRWHTATGALESLRGVPGDRRNVLAVLRDAIDRRDHPERRQAIRAYARHADPAEARPVLEDLVRYAPREVGLIARVELAMRGR